jgi:hypothetical protein
MRLNQELSVASFGNPSVRCTATPSRNGPVEEVWCALLLGRGHYHTTKFLGGRRTSERCSAVRILRHVTARSALLFASLPGHYHGRISTDWALYSNTARSSPIRQERCGYMPPSSQFAERDTLAWTSNGMVGSGVVKCTL